MSKFKMWFEELKQSEKIFKILINMLKKRDQNHRDIEIF